MTCERESVGISSACCLDTYFTNILPTHFLKAFKKNIDLTVVNICVCLPVFFLAVNIYFGNFS